MTVTPYPHMETLSPIAQHAEWLARLREHIYGSGDLNVATTIRHDACDLGRWLRNEAARYRNVPEYEAANKAHIHFHRRAAYVVALVAAGQRTEAIRELELDGPLRRASQDLVQSLRKLQAHMANDENNNNLF